ncbi:MAG TPA: hypothetical protein PKD09_21390 [Aggregatilinea sp.]|jgi:hypothetical protein|uniref:hypothetical protein n=1 Tax=Aggregatilinea sp. TaxID=2806333 RepID=UPI002C920C39|nr:hypothetical protein [Aggregatilinea sp.]HML24223.1 hypothetical protein [Aggregatilinea sp.]
MSEELNTSSPAEEKAPIKRFLKHQQSAIEETGKAVASLLPREFREHTNRAVEEGVAGWKALFKGVRVEVERSADRVANFGRAEGPIEGQSKVKVDVE